MDCITEAGLRDANGRFAPGSSGNPAGKKPGTRNRATILREALAEGEGIAAARIVIDKALAGNAVAARFVIGLLMPRPRDRAIELDLPDTRGASDVLAASNATVQAMAAGAITPQEALTVTRVLDFRLKAVKAAAQAEAAREKLPPLRRKAPSPAYGPLDQRSGGQGEGLAAPADPDRRDPRAQPSPLPSPASGEGVSLARKEEGLPMIACIPPAFSRRPAGMAGGARGAGVAPAPTRTHL